jgi:thiamine-phosphate pyrophosphorylase
LRAIEEYSKLLQNVRAERIEQLRYRSYTLAKACEITADSLERLAAARLYALLDGGASADAFAERARQIVQAGVQVVQLRDKRLDDRTLLARARALREIVSEAAPPQAAPPLFIINDRADIAVLARADGLHLGQGELSLADARGIVGPAMLVGSSTHTIAQARPAVLDGANYLGCGPTYPSHTKQFAEFPGLDFLRAVAAEIALPAFAIGGIDSQNLPAVLATGFTRVAVSGAVASSPEPAAEVGQLLKLLG